MSKINQYSLGSGDNVGRDKITNHVSNPKDLDQAVEDIQILLEKLEQTYNSHTTAGKMAIATKAIEYVENDTNLAKRILSALEKGGIAWLQSRIVNPAASFFLAGLEDWEKNKPDIKQELSQQEPQSKKSLLGLCADLGEAPSAKEIDLTRSESWNNFPREDF